MAGVQENRLTRRGFSLLELLVVIAILMMVMLVFGTFVGSAMMGPSLERHRAAIQSMVTNLRQEAAIRQVHVEMVFDYRHDEVVALSRRRLTTFAFEDMVGSGNVLGVPGGDARLIESRLHTLRDGKALELPNRGSTFTIPWMDTYDTRGQYEGVALTFDFFPMVSSTGDGGGGQGTIAQMGAVFTLEVADTRHDSVRLLLTSGGATAEASTWIAAWRWATIEIAVSRFGVSLYVDGRLDAAETPEGFQVPSVMGADLRFGGYSFRMDNLDLLALVSSSALELQGSQLIAWGFDPEMEANLQTKFIYDPDFYAGPITGEEEEDTRPTPFLQSIPPEQRVPPPAIVHVYFDAAGRLDPNRHPGAVQIYLVERTASELRRLEITFHPLGAITTEFLELFPWEEDGGRQ
jgi:hypothetical protein